MSREQLSEAGSMKWTTFPGTIGAFIAEMDFGVAPPIAEALHKAVDQAAFGYLPSGLERELQTSCQQWLAGSYGWDVEPETVRTVPDVLRGLEIMLDNFIAPGAPVVVPTPAYAPFLVIPQTLGHPVIEVPMALERETGIWRMDEEAIAGALADRPGVLVLCNPHNPLGRVFTRDELMRISAIVEASGSRVFSDEIHCPIVYSPHRHVPYATVSPEAARHTVTALSASKAWNLAGLKCAEVVATNPADRDRWIGLGYFATRGASNLGVIANTVAFREGRDWLDTVLEYLDGTRQAVAASIASNLPTATHISPQATYLAWVDVRAPSDRRELAAFIRETAAVAVTGGEECGEAGAGCFRLNFAMPRPLVLDALAHISVAFERAAA